MPETLAQKRQAAIQKLLYRLLELIMLDKLRHANSESGVSRRTKDYVDQVIQAARFTGVEEESEEFQCSTLEEFLQHWQEKGVAESVIENMRVYARALPQMFDGALSLEFLESRVRFRAVVTNEAGKVVKSKIITTAEVEPKALVIRAGRSYKLGVMEKNVRRSLSFSRRVERVDELTEADIKPIKERFKEFTCTTRVPTRWIKVLEEIRKEAEGSPTDDVDTDQENKPVNEANVSEQ